MKRALIIAASDELYRAISEVLEKSEFEENLCARGISQAEDMISAAPVVLVFIYSSCPEDAETAFAKKISARPDMALVFMVREAQREETEQALLRTKALVLGTPISRQGLLQSIKIARSLTGKFAEMQRENEALKQKIEELKVVDRAKCCLISFLRMDEAQAHRYIQKRAMDMRVTQREVAEDILKTYEY